MLTSPHAFPLWAHVHALVVLAEQGSFTAAADRLGLSKAAVSERVRELERQLGLPLVTRTTRSVRLTPAGQQLVADTQPAFAHIASRVALVQDSAGEARGLLRITAPVALARQQLVPRLAAFQADWPQVQIELDLSDRLRTLAMEGLDLAIRHSPSVPDSHVAHRLCGTRSVLVASGAYLQRRGVPQQPQDLAEHACLHYPRPGRQAVWHCVADKARGRRTPPVTVAVRGPLSANNSEALRDAALAGLGIALVPDFSAQAALQQGALLAVLPQWQVQGAFAQDIWLVRPHAAQVPRTVQVFTQWLRKAFAPGFAPGLAPTSG
ncbi:LysR family transcriptional regulator [Comamonas serinivorans]|uniref:LysR family transcriptional regulator n=1 Tax=Comamonas serinivorans TaxID=1082851 RepID=A0A1Y0ESC0_9BURK|nr:LysR family transcriptional regulator [Comamonas serinivorans]ARU06557.1 LysR family transcriptional regulator [Comamonas serinivorans]